MPEESGCGEFFKEERGGIYQKEPVSYIPMIVEFMDMHFPKIHPNLLQFLENNNKYGMKMLIKDYAE